MSSRSAEGPMARYGSAGRGPTVRGGCASRRMCLARCACWAQASPGGRAGGQSKQTGARCWMPTPPSPCLLLLLLLLLPPACLPALRLQAVFTRQCGLACSPSRLKCWR